MGTLTPARSVSRAEWQETRIAPPPQPPQRRLTVADADRNIDGLRTHGSSSKGGGMDKKKAELYRKRLLEKQEDLLRLVSKSDQDGREADEEGTQDIADKAANAYTKEFLFHQSNDNRLILQLVNEALERVKNGSYGQCVACNQEVQVKRLEAVPWARHCIECQEKQDQGLL